MHLYLKALNYIVHFRWALMLELYSTLRWKCIDHSWDFIFYFITASNVSWMGIWKKQTNSISTRTIYVILQIICGNGKHAFDKVTLTAQVNVALCKSTSQLSGDTLAIWETKVAVNTVIASVCLEAALLKMEAWHRWALEKVLKVDK